MYRISKRFDFCASHQLLGLPKTHQCARLHGHNYSITVRLKADTVNKIGFIVDYGEMDKVKKMIDKNFEHRHLNDAFNFNPTAENMAKFFYVQFKKFWPQVYEVSVKETDKTEATYSDD